MRLVVFCALVVMLDLLTACGEQTPDQELGLAVIVCNPHDVTEALAHKADVNGRKINSDFTPLMGAAEGGCAAAARSLIAAGANVNAKIEIDRTTRTGDPLSGATALIIGSMGGRGNVQTIKVLISAGADAKTAVGLTALELAARYGRPEIVEALIAAGADVNTRGPGGLTPLADALFTAERMANAPHFGTAAGHARVAAILRAHGGLDIGRNK